MADNRVTEVLRLVEGALAREGAERASYLDAACGADAALRREVEALLAEPSSGARVLDTPPSVPDRPPLVAGTQLGHYRILEKLGEGGMGIVYKAQDLHLARSVALKVLPPEHLADPDRKQRFTQEARAASALNHPNIITIHDIASDAGVDYIAMEYVPGRTLDQLIHGKGMRLNDALKIAVQVADALAAAHAVGIIHRDV